jgi:hypothetical protein
VVQLQLLRQNRKGQMVMEYLRIEKALTRIAKEPEQGGKYYQTATVFEGILSDVKTTPREKAKKIADLIENGNK